MNVEELFFSIKMSIPFKIFTEISINSIQIQAIIQIYIDISLDGTNT